MARQEDERDAAVLAVLSERPEEGMTIFELRSQVDADIDTIESSLERLKSRDLIETEQADDRLTIRPTEAAMDVADDRTETSSWIDQIRERLPF